jgi:erythromycin esterase-like protein
MEGAEADAFGAVLQRLVDGEWEELGASAPLPADGEAKFFRFLDGLKVEIGAKSAKTDGALRSDADFWRQTIESTASVARNAWDPDARTAEGRTKVRRQRGQQMARNLAWLAKKRYPGRKIVVWTSAFHAARQLKAIDPGTGRDERVESYRTTETMADGVYRELGDKVYTLGFTAYQGSVGSALQSREPEPLGRPTAGSLEDLMAQAGLESALIDFRRPLSGGEWLRRPLLSRPLGYTEMMADWGEILDGMLFTKVMEPSRRAAK